MIIAGNSSSATNQTLINRTLNGSASFFSMSNTTRTLSKASSSYTSTLNLNSGRYFILIFILENSIGRWREYLAAGGSAVAKLIGNRTTVAGSDSATNIYIGNNEQSTMGYTGNIYEMIMFQRAISTTEMDSIVLYLRNKWAL